MKKDTKSKKKAMKDDDKSQILREITTLDDVEIFQNEYNKIKESLEEIKNQPMKNIIVLNFLYNKLEEVEKQLNLANALKSKDTYLNNEIRQLVNAESAEITKKLIVENIKTINKLQAGTCQDDDSSTPSNEDHGEELTYRLRVIYSEGSDSYPQFIKIRIVKNLGFSSFLRELRKTLDIYEFAKFKIVLIMRDCDFKIVDSLDDLDVNEENSLKIVPMSYTL
jgi:hypothetical protein